MNTLRHVSLLLFILLISATFYSCSDTSDSDTLTDPDLFKLGEFTDNGLTIAAYSRQPLSVGYNEIFFEAHESGEPFSHPHIHLTPVMNMEEHSHASPFAEPGHHRDSEHNLYKGWAIFTMASGTMGNWELQITVHDQDNTGFEAEGVIEIEVQQSNRVKTFMTESGERYVLTWILPEDPEVGLNDLQIALHQRESMMNFPPVLNASIDFEPWMPSMDHGSNNNVAPIHSENGFYEGQVNFNMTGDWELRFDIEHNGDSLGHHVFELNF